MGTAAHIRPGLTQFEEGEHTTVRYQTHRETGTRLWTPFLVVLEGPQRLPMALCVEACLMATGRSLPLEWPRYLLKMSSRARSCQWEWRQMWTESHEKAFS